jgi:hypothetical protein
MKGKQPETVTAERLAALLEAPETPPALRDLLRVVCVTFDTFAADRINANTMAFQFGSGDEITPSRVRRKLPKMLRKVGQWRATIYPHELDKPSEKGGDHAEG